MSIAIALAVNDGVVLAADSAATIALASPPGTQTVPGGVVAVYNNANKILHLHKELPIGCIAFGAGSIGNASITTLLKDFRATLMGGSIQGFRKEQYRIEDIVPQLGNFLVSEAQRAKVKPTMGIFVVGYSAGANLSETWALNILNGVLQAPNRTRNDTDSGLVWGGEAEAVSRLLVGFGTQLPRIIDELLPASRGQKNAALVGQIAARMQIPLMSPAMPIQDAIDLARFLVETSIQFSRFSPGPPTVGGPVEIAAITKHEGFKWIVRKHYYAIEFNREANRP